MYLPELGEAPRASFTWRILHRLHVSICRLRALPGRRGLLYDLLD
jgi:hypothetical protein